MNLELKNPMHAWPMLIWQNRIKPSRNIGVPSSHHKQPSLKLSLLNPHVNCVPANPIHFRCPSYVNIKPISPAKIIPTSPTSLILKSSLINRLLMKFTIANYVIIITHNLLKLNQRQTLNLPHKTSFIEALTHMQENK